ncbi:hypothetical protein PI125_g21275 [Phytophthora idaei]|nr:hypothetical protein PI125_g21275 [Phytophthora idaei]
MSAAASSSNSTVSCPNQSYPHHLSLGWGPILVVHDLFASDDMALAREILTSSVRHGSIYLGDAEACPWTRVLGTTAFGTRVSPSSHHHCSPPSQLWSRFVSWSGITVGRSLGAVQPQLHFGSLSDGGHL